MKKHNFRNQPLNGARKCAGVAGLALAAFCVAHEVRPLEARAAAPRPARIRSVAYTPDEPLVLAADAESDDVAPVAERLAPPAPVILDPDLEPESADSAPSPDLRAKRTSERALNTPATIPGTAKGSARRLPGTYSSALPDARAANLPQRPVQQTAATLYQTPAQPQERLATITLNSPAAPEYSTVQKETPARAVERAKYAQSAELEYDGVLESLDDAIRIALEQSRTQRALAHKRSAAQATSRAASALRNPKINNTTSYVGMINKPTMKSDVDLTAATNLASALPSEVVEALAPVLANLPTTIQASTPLTDRNFVTSVTSVSLPLYLGGRVRALEEATQAMTQAIAAGEEVGEQQVKLETTEAYFLVLRTRQLRLVAQEATAAAEEHLNNSERMFGVGMLTKNVVLAAQVALAESRQLELRLANAQDLAESAYNRVLWRPLDSPVHIAEAELVGEFGDLESLTETALRTRGELQALSAETRALQAQVKVARADVLPQVAAVGAYTYFENSRLKDNSNATAAVGVTWTPFDGGISRARQQSAQQNAMAVARLREETASAVQLQVRQAYLAENEARERLDVARVAAEQADENYRVVSRAFQEGIVNHTEVLDAATMRTSAKSALANAKYDAILAAERLKGAVGIL